MDKIEKKLDKDSYSSMEKGCKSRDIRSETRNYDRHHQPSLKHSTRRSCGSSTPSLVRNHKNKSVVDELLGKMNKIKPLTFDGEHNKDEDA
jgi:hypothetical protein